MATIFPATDNADPVAETVCLFHVVRGEKDRSSLLIQVTEQGEDHLGALHVKTAGGFIEEKEFGFMDERHREDEPLLHAFGVGLHLLVFSLQEPHHTEQLG